LSLGFFFWCISSSIILQIDLNGIPSFLIVQHFKSNLVQNCYRIPDVTILLGVILLATAYAFDFGERCGCNHLVFGCVAFPFFIFSVYILMSILRKKRQRLVSDDGEALCDSSGKRLLGNAWISSWSDWLITPEAKRMWQRNKRPTMRPADLLRVSSGDAGHNDGVQDGVKDRDNDEDKDTIDEYLEMEIISEV